MAPHLSLWQVEFDRSGFRLRQGASLSALEYGATIPPMAGPNKHPADWSPRKLNSWDLKLRFKQIPWVLWVFGGPKHQISIGSHFGTELIWITSFGLSPQETKIGQNGADGANSGRSIMGHMGFFLGTSLIAKLVIIIRITGVYGN